MTFEPRPGLNSSLRRADSPRRRRAPRAGRRLAFAPERLEGRQLLAAQAVTIGTAAWVSVGPAPMSEDGQINSGAIQAIAVDPTNTDRMFIASADGGVWRTTNANTTDPKGPTWTPLTDNLPFLGTSDIAFSPLDPSGNTLFVATGRFSNSFQQAGPPVGLYTTNNAGAATVTWTQLGQDTFTGLSIHNVLPTSVLDPSTGKQVVLVATAYDPATGTSYANGKSTGLYRSADAGQTWTLISGQQLPDGSNVLPAGDVTQVVADLANPNSPVFFAALPGQGVYRSANAGVSWQPVVGNAQLGDLSQGGRIRLAVSNAGGADVLYAAVANIDPANQSSKLIGVYRSTDQGANWQPMGVPPTEINSLGQATTNLSIVADPANPAVVYVGGDSGPGGWHYRGVYSPQGTQWSALDGANANNTSTHSDSRNMVFDKNGNILESDDGGIFRLSSPSDPATRRWTSLVGNLAITELNGVSYDSANHTVFGGAQDNGTPQQSKAGDPTSFIDASSGDGQLSQVDNTSRPGFSIHYVSSQNGSLGRGVYDSSGNAIDGGPRLTKNTVTLTVAGTDKGLSEVDKTVPFTLPFALDQADPTRMLVGTNYLYESKDSGANLTSVGGLNNGAPQGNVGAVSALAYGGFLNGTANPDVAYVGTNGVVTKGQPSNGQLLLLRTQAGGAFNPVTSYKGTTPQQIVLDPNDWRTVYVLDSNGRIFRSGNATDPNTPFVDITGNLGTLLTNLRTIGLEATGPNTAPVLYAGGLGGVAATADPTASPATWTKFGTLPDVMVTALTYNAADNVLAAATFGRGFWEVKNVSGALGHPAPTLAPSTFAATYTAGGAPVGIVDPNLTVASPSSGTVSGAVVTLTNPLDGASDFIAADTTGTKINASVFDPKTGKVVLTGTDTPANYQKVLRGLLYNDSAAAPNQAARVITVVVNDGSASSTAATSTISIAPATPAAPTVADPQTQVDFDADTAGVQPTSKLTLQDPGSADLVSATVTLINPIDGAAEGLSVTTTGTVITATYNPGTGVLSLQGADTLAHYQQVLDSLVYEDFANVPDVTPREIVVTVSDGIHTSLADSITINIDPVNHAPVLDPSASFRLDPVSENSPADPGTYVTDLLDSASKANAYTDVDPNDPRGIAIVGVDNSHGIWEFSTDGGDTFQRFDAPSPSHATLLADDEQTLLRFVPAANFSGSVAGLQFRAWDQSTGIAQVEHPDGTDGSIGDTTVNGGNSAYSTTVDNATVTVIAVNQAPSFTKGPNVTVAAGSGAQSIAGWATNILAGPPSEAGQALNFLVSTSNPSLFAVAPAVSPTGTLTFTPAPGASGSATVTVALHDNGGTANGGVDTSAPQQFTITVTPAQPQGGGGTGTVTPGPVTAPVALPAVYVVPRRRHFAVFENQGLLADNPGFGKTALSVVLDQGPRFGRLFLNADGSFLYVPRLGFRLRGHDQFTYRVVSGTGVFSAPATVRLVRPAHFRRGSALV